MSDIRARRTAVLAAAAKAKSDAKAQAADQAIRRLIRRGEPVTFQAVQREAGVSHAFLGRKWKGSDRDEPFEGRRVRVGVH